MQLALNPVQGLQRFAGCRQTDDDLAARELVRIKGMRGLTEFQQGVIRGVGGIVDGLLSQRCETLLEIFRRSADLYIPDNSRGISGTECGICDLDWKILSF